jgi:hypothetical protein
MRRLLQRARLIPVSMDGSRIPGGYVRFVDVTLYTTCIFAPPEFLGNYVALGVQSISYNFHIFVETNITPGPTTGFGINPYALGISGPGGSAYWEGPFPPGRKSLAALPLSNGLDFSERADRGRYTAGMDAGKRKLVSAAKRRDHDRELVTNQGLRQLLVVGSTAVIQHAKPGCRSASPWLLALLGRKPRKLAAVALANKTARIVWAMMTSGQAYRPTPAAA